MSIIRVWQRRSWLLTTTSDQPLYTPWPWSRLNPTSKAACVCSQQEPTSCHKIMVSRCQVPFPKSKTTFQIEMYCMQCFLKSKYIKSRAFNDKNRWIIKKVMVFKKLLQHLAARGTYSPGDWRCDEAWREQTLVYLQWCACRGRFIAHGNWTSCAQQSLGWNICPTPIHNDCTVEVWKWVSTCT